MILNKVTKFHIPIKTTGLIAQTPQKLNFHEHRAITPERMVRYGQLSNLKKTLV